jgi:hypothetical protein
MSDKAVADGPDVHPKRSVKTLKMHFTKPVTFGFFFLVSQRDGLRLRQDGPSLVPDDALFSFGRSVV